MVRVRVRVSLAVRVGGVVPAGTFAESLNRQKLRRVRLTPSYRPIHEYVDIRSAHFRVVDLRSRS